MQTMRCAHRSNGTTGTMGVLCGSSKGPQRHSHIVRRRAQQGPSATEARRRASAGAGANAAGMSGPIRCTGASDTRGGFAKGTRRRRIPTAVWAGAGGVACGTTDRWRRRRAFARAGIGSDRGCVKGGAETVRISYALRSAWRESLARIVPNGNWRNSPRCRVASDDSAGLHREALVETATSAPAPTGVNGIQANGSSGSVSTAGGVSAAALAGKKFIEAGQPGRWSVVFGIFLSFVLCNMDKVNMSVAIIPMSQEFGWTASQRGLISSAFFWGYALTQVPGGMLANKFHGKYVLGMGVALWSLGTALAPATAPVSLVLLCLTRLLVGLGEGVAPPSATDVLARTIPKKERASAVGMVFGGMDIGSVVGLLVAQSLIVRLGWQSVFYIYAILGAVWLIDWANRGCRILTRIEEEKQQQMDAQAAEEVEGATRVGVPAGNGAVAAAAAAVRSEDSVVDADDDESVATSSSIPWRSFFSSKHVWAIICAHFCFNWGYYTLLAWLPSFFEGAIGLNLAQTTVLSILPYICMSGMSAIVGPTADWLISKRKWSTTTVRKLAQSISFVVPSCIMLLVSAILPPSPAAATPLLCIQIEVLLCIAFACWTCSRAGLYCNHQDLSPKYAGILLGITNTAGALPGIIGVWCVGLVLDSTGSWALALFLPSVAIQLFGAVVWLLFATGKRQPFDNE